MKHLLPISMLIVLLAVLSGEGAARADGESAIDLFDRGVKLYLEGKPEEAVAAFRRANEIDPTWKLQYNIGQCEAALKRYGLAVEAFEIYLAEGGDETPLERRDQVLAELDRLRRMVGFVRVYGDDGIDIYVDDIKYGHTPMSKAILVTAGVLHGIWFIKDGVKVHSVQETVSGGDTLKITVPGNKAAAAPMTAPAPTPATVPQPKPVPAKPDKKGISPALFWAGLTGTVLSGGLTLAMGLLASAKWEEARDELDHVQEDPWNESMDTVDDLRDTGRRFQVIGYVGIGLTSAFLITTIVAIPLTDWGRRKRANREVALSLTPFRTFEAEGLLLSGRF